MKIIFSMSLRSFLWVGLIISLVSCASNSNKVVSEAQTDSIQTTVIHLTDLPATNDVLRKNTAQDYFEYLDFFDERLVVISTLKDSLTYASHPFLTSARLAYAQHRPLVISPDIVWLVIERGFATHIDIHAEELRSKFVPFEGKKELEIYAEPGLMNKSAEEWEPLFAQFSEQIAVWTGSELVQTLKSDFSTSTPTSITASEIMIMSAMQHYFDYHVTSICGIPDIYLEGTAQDWNHLIEKANALRQYNLDWWIDELEPVLKKIAATANGECDIVFWQSIIRKKDIPVEGEEMCGYRPPHEQIDGWIVKFYPYTRYSRRTLDFLYDTDISELPDEESAAPLKYTDIDNTVYNLDIHAGLVGIEEDTTTRALRLVIAWWVTEQLTQRERYK